MNVSLIAEHEQSFNLNGVDAQGQKHVFRKLSIPISGEATMLDYTECRRDNDDESFFYKEAVAKERIVLHFTAGYLKNDIAALTRNSNHVSVPFVIARSGEIFSLWSSKYWSYHLGSGTIGGNTTMSKSSIGIELSNIGYLRKKGEDLVTPYSDTDVYCKLSETEYYGHVEAGFRDYQYYASFTDAQYKSLISLLRYLTAKYDIPRELLPESKRFELFPDAAAASFKGIVSHINYRSSKKWDIGPAFDWSRITSGIK